MERGAFRARPLAKNNKGMARKRYFPLFFPKQEKPYVSLALIANQAFNIFFDPFISGDQTVFGIKKRDRRQTRFLNLKKPHLIADLAGNIFASCQSILIAVFWTALLRRCFSLTVLSRQPLYIQFYTFLLLGYRNSLTKKYLLILRIRIFTPHTGH